MLKFDIIESTQQISKINKFANFLDEKRHLFNDIDISSKNQNCTTYIVAESAGKSIIGGACLVKKELEAIDEDVRELITSRTFQEGFVWECSSIYLEISSTFPPSGTNEAEALSRKFFRDLYEEFVKFGHKNNVSFVIMRLTAGVYASTKEVGLWPYVVELKPYKSHDGLFHGVLPLKGSQYESYKKKWDILDAYFQDISYVE